MMNFSAMNSKVEIAWFFKKVEMLEKFQENCWRVHSLRKCLGPRLNIGVEYFRVETFRFEMSLKLFWSWKNHWHSIMMLGLLASLIHLLHLKKLGSLPLLADGEPLWRVNQNYFCFVKILPRAKTFKLFGLVY